MTAIPFALDDARARIGGALGLPAGRYGSVMSRLSTRSLAQVHDPELRLVATSTSGVRLELRTDAERLELELLPTQLQVLDRPPTKLSLDLVVDGHVTRQIELPAAARIWVRAPGEVELIDHPPVTVPVDDLGPGVKDLQVWFPHNGFTELVAVHVPDDATLVPVRTGRPRWVHYGSSISHCVEARRPTDTWPATVARRHDLDLINLGLAGHCQLDQMVARDIRDAAPDLVSLKIGVNVVNHDTFRERTFVPALHGFLDTLREGLPDTPVLVLTPIICPPAEDHAGPTLLAADGTFRTVERSEELSRGALSLGRIRELIATVVSTRVAAGDAHLALGDGLELFGPEDVGDLHDALHPTADGYLRIAERFSSLAFGPSGCWAGLDRGEAS
ncbi:MAG TPA: GDSL-type esterase/lipase family protein [Mycobacteriales bacterium]|nr:GDSL-type esterase/lipase family protein [Mycobacteriales bacterium]